jgi:hypothetical protein
MACEFFAVRLAADDTDWHGAVAAPWVPEPYTADEDNTVRAEFVWAALDCPTAYAAGSPAGFPTILLGRQTVRILRLPKVGEACVDHGTTGGTRGAQIPGNGVACSGPTAWPSPPAKPPGSKYSATCNWAPPEFRRVNKRQINCCPQSVVRVVNGRRRGT